MVHWLLYSPPGIAVLTLLAAAGVAVAVWTAIWVAILVAATVARPALRHLAFVSHRDSLPAAYGSRAPGRGGRTG
jgi:uncharacterized membrane protein